MQCKTAKERCPNYIQLQSNRDNIAAICNVCGKVRRQNSCIERHEDRAHTSVLNIQLVLQATLSSQLVTVASSSDQSIGKDAILTSTSDPHLQPAGCEFSAASWQLSTQQAEEVSIVFPKWNQSKDKDKVCQETREMQLWSEIRGRQLFLPWWSCRSTSLDR